MSGQQREFLIILRTENLGLRYPICRRKFGLDFCPQTKISADLISKPFFSCHWRVTKISIKQMFTKNHFAHSETCFLLLIPSDESQIFSNISNLSPGAIATPRGRQVTIATSLQENVNVKKAWTDEHVTNVLLVITRSPRKAAKVIHAFFIRKWFIRKYY